MAGARLIQEFLYKKVPLDKTLDSKIQTIVSFKLL